MSYKRILVLFKMVQSSELVNVRVPAHIVEWLEELVKKGTYKSRSEAMRDFIRLHVLRSQKE